MERNQAFYLIELEKTKLAITEASASKPRPSSKVKKNVSTEEKSNWHEETVFATTLDVCFVFFFCFVLHWIDTKRTNL